MNLVEQQKARERINKLCKQAREYSNEALDIVCRLCVRPTVLVCGIWSHQRDIIANQGLEKKA